MKSMIIAAALASAIVSRIGAAQAQECATFTTGEILCDDGNYAYYWSPDSGQWHVLDREATAAALGLDSGESAGDSADAGGEGSTIYGGGGSLTSTDDGCTMYSSPGYSFGESFSFSSGC